MSIEKKFKIWERENKSLIENEFGLYDGWQENFPNILELCESSAFDIRKNLGDVLFLLEITNESEYMKYELASQIQKNEINTEDLQMLAQKSSRKNQRWQIYSIYDEIYTNLTKKQLLSGLDFLSKCKSNFNNTDYELKRLNQSIKNLQSKT